MARFGALPSGTGTRFCVWSQDADRVWVSLFDEAGERETGRLELSPEGGGVFSRTVPDTGPSTRYGFRADGRYEPARGLRFDPDKLLVDPYATILDRPFVHDPRLAARRGEGGDTAPLVPKAIVQPSPAPVALETPRFAPGGLIYEISVKAFTMRHPDVPQAQRGTLAALSHPAIIGHLKRLGVSAVELMPITAWIDERHLPPLGLSNAWGYNPVTFMALDPRLVPGGLAELRDTVAALHAADIGVILDLVFNHTGESDAEGPTLSFRGLADGAWYRHPQGEPGAYVNDAGTGNSVATQHPVMREMICDTLRHFALQAGVDGFRFDLGTALGRCDDGFDRDAPLLREIAADHVIGSRVLIVEPWDVGPGGYQLGNFNPPFLEWNDRYRDDIRRFWRGDAGLVGALATRIAGSADVFTKERTRSVNFIAAHDGMTLADLVSYQAKHNLANGEDNRDGHDENLSWNHGAEGPSDDAAIAPRRRADLKALLATLFASRGTIMLTAGDEFGRTQHGNNNAYAQDNSITWLDWDGRDRELEDHAADLAAFRRASAQLGETSRLTGDPAAGSDLPDVAWLTETGEVMSEAHWHEPDRRRLAMILAGSGGRIAVFFNADRRETVHSPPNRPGYRWAAILPRGLASIGEGEGRAWRIAGRSVAFFREHATSSA